jgi:hypothetical protein
VFVDDFFLGLLFDPKEKATRFSETSVDFSHPARLYIPEDKNL